MLAWLLNNLSTMIVGAVIAAIVVLIIVHLVRAKRQGKTTCGCGCSNCPSSGICHKS